MNRSKNKNEKPKFVEVEADMEEGKFSLDFFTGSGSISNNPTIEEILNPGDFGWGRSEADQGMMEVDGNHDPLRHQEDVHMKSESGRH